MNRKTAPEIQAIKTIHTGFPVSENSIYIWRKKFGTMEPNQVSELKRIMQENARLKKLVAERDLEIEVMKEIAAKKW